MRELLATPAVLLFVVACGGGAFSAGSGESGGNGTTAGTDAGGASNGGNGTTAGADAGGVSNGGRSGAGSGGANVGGVSVGGASGGMSAGGSDSGATACDSAEDCMSCAYPTAPRVATDCYCTNCNDTPLSKTACAANQAQYEKVCAKVLLACPAIQCVAPPEPVCEMHRCMAGKHL